MKKSLIVILSCLYLGITLANPGYYRYPDLHNDTLVFTAEGDLWVADINIGKAQRLTTHVAEETQASLSNDGQRIAFVANYEGAREVYVISINGGLAKRVTFENARVRVHGWTASGEIIYSSNGRVGIPRNWQIATINPDTLIEKTLPLMDAVEASFDADDSMVFFVRFGLQLSTDNSKIYRGGAMGKLWKYKLNSKQEAIAIASEHNGSIRKPMSYKDKVYFISDASGADNIWSLTKATGATKQLTTYSDWPIRTANLGNGKIVYQVGADIKTLDLTTQQTNDIDLELTSDFPHLREHWLNNPLKFLTSARLAGNFEKVVLTARGRVVVANIDKSRLVQIAIDPSSRSRKAILSHDGKWVYAINDSSGELEIWQYASDGSNQAKQLTHDGGMFRWNMSLSPDGKWLAHDDKNGKLYLLNIDTGKNKTILSNSSGLNPIIDINWSNNSLLLSISRVHVNENRNQIMLYSINENKFETLTSLKYDSYAPAFSHDDKWLYFLSNRNFKVTPSGPWGDRVLGATMDRRTQIFAYSLQPDAKFVFQKPNELIVKKINKEGQKNSKNKKGKKIEKKEKYKVNWTGLKQRLWQLPIDPGNYEQLAVNENYIYLIDQINEPASKPKIVSIKLGPDAKTNDFTTGVKSFALSNDGKKIMVHNDSDKIFIVDAGEKFPKETNNLQIKTDDWQILIDPVQEWKQLFHDTWLMHRDSLFDKNMRGVNWQVIEEKYAPLLAQITDRYELNDVFKQMVGELNTLHSQVRGGDVPSDNNRAKAAVLGADLELTKQGVIIKNIYKHESERPETASPLSQPGVDAKKGDIIVKINGQPSPDLQSVHKLLRNQLKKQVLLELKRKGKTIKNIITPVSTRENYKLRYQHWVLGKRAKVIEANPEIGYFHLASMVGSDMAHFAREFYDNYQKQGLIIDVRRNGGGNVDSWIIEKLLRKNWMFWKNSRGEKYYNMQQTFAGHLVVLCDEFTYSDGETFVAGVQALDLAHVIGKRTTGAGVWLTGRNRVSDGGISRVAEFPQFALDGRWIVEGHGVEPDSEVDNMPYATFIGEDAQLEAAIDYLTKEIEQSPLKKLKAQELPDVNTPADDILD